MRAFLRRNTPNSGTTTGDQHPRKEHAHGRHHLLSADGYCAKPACGNAIVVDESYYIDGCGYICRQCEEPLPDWWFDIEPPY